MPDITMCEDQKCPLNKDCYRYCAIPEELYQSYGNFNFNEKTKSCEYFMNFRKKKYYDNV